MKPIIGWSFDGRRSAFDEIEIGLPHFHNGYLDFMVRGGMVGLLILFSLIARTIWRILRKAKRKPDIYAHFAAFIISLLVYNITEMTFGAWSNLMWIMFLFIYFLSERSRGHRRRKGRHTQVETTTH
jgi:O-antigen ligase